MNIDVRYDSERQLLYVQLRKPTGFVIRTEDFGGDRYVDYDEADEVVGIEFLALPVNGLHLRGLPEADRIADAIDTLHELEPVR